MLMNTPQKWHCLDSCTRAHLIWPPGGGPEAARSGTGRRPTTRAGAPSNLSCTITQQEDHSSMMDISSSNVGKIGPNLKCTIINICRKHGRKSYFLLQEQLGAQSSKRKKPYYVFCLAFMNKVTLFSVHTCSFRGNFLNIIPLHKKTILSIPKINDQ